MHSDAFAVQEMCRSPNPVVRNNLLVALSDMVRPHAGAAAAAAAAVCRHRPPRQPWKLLALMLLPRRHTACAPHAGAWRLPAFFWLPTLTCPRPSWAMGVPSQVVQFTGLVDTYVGRLAAMVCDPHELVRRQALALLANLLGRDYVKWRGALFHRQGAACCAARLPPLPLAGTLHAASTYMGCRAVVAHARIAICTTSQAAAGRPPGGTLGHRRRGLW